MIDVALLGTGGMMPLPDRFLTSLMCRLNGRFLVIDCGEATQITMKILGWGFKNLDVVCITHFHADHIAGLPGLLLSVGNSGRTEHITLVGPKGLQKVVESLCIIAPELPFGIDYVELGDDIVEGLQVGGFVIGACLLEHRVTCYGYSINVARSGKFDPIKAAGLGIPKNQWSLLQKNENVFIGDKTYTPDMVLGNQRKGIKVCYATDTRPINRLVDFVSGADLFIGEGIYGSDEKLGKAVEYTHMLFSEAAGIAKAANVKELWLTHFSPSLTCPGEYLDVAKNIFANTALGYDRVNKTIFFEG
ncbi:MAG: ribonuclease Z [Clostridiales bacterium]|jgi:ribonuclease Z|nr:ribonuclease Z [Clostridiales bacterium]